MNQLRRPLGCVLLAAACLALVCLWPTPIPPGANPRASDPPTPEAFAPSRPATNAAAAVATPVEWNRWRAQLPAAKPAIEDVTEWPAGRTEPFDRFREWQARYGAADIADRVQLEPEGVTLARARRAALARWIERDPEFALQQAVGPDARRSLPAAVLAELERWIEGRGALEVQVRCGPQVKPAEQIKRTVRVGGEEFLAFIYGRRMGSTTKYDLPIHAIAVDGRLALHQSPVRQLEPGEAAAQGLDPQAIHLETGGAVVTAAHAPDAFAIEARLIQREQGRGPVAAGLKAGELPAGLPPGTMAFPPSAGWTLGVKRILIIRVDFSDDPGGPFDRNSGQAITTNAMATVMSQTDQFYRDNSQNQTSLQTTYVPVVLRLPQTKAAYGNLDPMSDFRQASLAAARTYDQQNGNTGLYNPDLYDLDITVFSDIPTANFGFGGLAFVGAKGQLVHAEFSLRILGHETGHNYGLQHANRWDVTGSDPIDPAGTHNEYGDDYDMMGLNFINKTIHFNEWFKAYLGWLSTSDWRTAPTSGVYRVFRHDDISASGIRAITAGQSSDRAYWFGFRRELSTQTANNSAATNFLANGVEIRWGMQAPGIGSNMTQGSRLLNMTPATTNFTRHPLPVGQTFTDPAFNFSVTPASVGGTAPNEYIDLSVTYSTPPVSITQNPQSQTVFAGANVTFTVTATGTGPITYQWTYNGANIPGATSASLVLNNVTTNQSGSYLVQVTNPGGTVSSQTATLTVNPAPVAPSITQQPASLVVSAGSGANFSVTATGDAPLSYRWLFNGATVGGATAATLQLTGVGTNQAGNYQVIITNAAGSVTSSVATLTVNRLAANLAWTPPAAITYGTLLSAVQLNATALVPGTFAYAPPGGTLLTAGTQSLAVVFTPTDTAIYLTDTGNVSLVVNPAPLIVSADNQSRGFGLPNPTLTITYTGFVNSETSSVLTTLPSISTTATPASPPGSYPITVSGAAGSNYTVTHVAGTLTVSVILPAITLQPTNQTVVAGATVTFVSAATGGPAPGLQWYFNGLALAGETNATLTLTNVQPDQAGGYSLVASNVGGSAASATAVLAVLVPPTITGQPQGLSALPGSNVLISVTATGTLPLAYQWFYNGTNALAAATNASLSLPGATTNQSGNYHVVITNSAGSVTSSIAVLAVGRLAPPITWAAPAPVTYGVALGAGQLNATATVPGTMTYAPAAGTVLSAGTNLLTVVFTPDDPASYLTNSASVSLVVNRAPLAITADIKGRIYGQANPPLTLTYTGFVNGESPTVLLTLPTTSTTADSASPPGVYPITVAGATAANYAITHVNGSLAVTALAPAITTQPTNTTAFVNTFATFHVGAGGFPTPEFQWFYNGALIPNGTNSSLSVAVLGTNQAGAYHVVATNVAGSVTSSVVTLTVNRIIPAVSWPTPSPVTYGTLLGAAQLNASTPVPGTFAYSPAGGTLLPAGAHTLTNVFSPTDPAKYQPVTNTVGLVVNPAPLTVTVGSQSRLFGFTNQPFAINYSGFVNGETVAVLTTPAVAGTAADINTLPGTHAITVSGATAANYSITHSNGTLTIAANSPPTAAFGTNNVVVLEDSGPATVPGFAVFGVGPALDAGQTVTNIVVGNDNPALFAVAPALSGGTLTFTPATNANGTALVTVISQDDGGTGGGGVDAGTNTFTITVTAVNDAPALQILPAIVPAPRNWVAGIAPPRYWTGIASSADGQKLVAVGNFFFGSDGQVFTSTDYGATWMARGTPRNWIAVASSADGTKLAAVAKGDRVYTSTDSGVTWTARENVRDWVSIASSSDGTKLAAVVGGPQALTGDQIYVSSDSGVTWTARGPSQAWMSIASSADGTKLVAVSRLSPIYTSSDSGVTWVPREFTRQWFSVASSADGMKLVAGVIYGQIHTSTDAGVSWTAQNIGGYWNAIASSADGTKLVAASQYEPDFSPGRLFVSADSGVTWTPQTGAGNRSWVAVASSHDGSKLAAAEVQAGQLYSYVAPHAVSVLENSGAYTQLSFITVTNAGAANEASQNLSVAVTNDNNALFSVQPAVDSSGTLTFTPAANANGHATVTAVAQDDAGTANGGTNTGAPQIFTITITPVNSAPSIAFTTNNVVVSLNSGAATRAGHAIFSVGPANEAGQTITAIATTNDNPALFSAQPDIDSAGTLTFTPATSAFGSAVVTVVVQDDGGTASGGVDLATNSFTITVTAAPLITVAPAGGTVNALESTNFSVTAVGTAPLVYQWLLNGTALPGQTSSTLAVSGATTNHAGAYQVVITNAIGAVTSSVASLTVNRLTPAITWGAPLPITYGTALSGTQLNASSGVAGTFAYSPTNGAILPAGTPALGATFTPSDSSVYLPNTASVSLTVNPAPLTATAQNQTRVYGETNPVFTVSYSGFVNGEGTNVLTTLATATSGADTNSLPGGYVITASGATAANYSITHVSGTLTVTADAPAISVPPVSQTNSALGNATFGVTATGTAPLAYQWSFNGGSVANATNAVLVVSNLTTAAAGNYLVVVTNVAGAVTSAVAVLTVERLVPAVTWTNPAAITYGTALGGTQLNASTPVAGTFAYSPANGTILPAGTHGLTNEFTPTDGTAYVGTTGTVSVVVNPAPLTVTAGSQTRAFGTANGPLTVGYSGLVNGETTNVLTSLAVAATAADVNSLPGSYAITVSGAAGANYNVTHVAGLLTVTAVPPALVLEATNQTVVAGTDVSLVAVATGAPAPGYQWYFDTTNLLAGATNGTLVVTNAQPVNAGGYTVVAANAGGSVTSTVATLTVLVPPAISVGPVSQTNSALGNATFGVTATGTAPLAYQWSFNGGSVANATNAVLVVSNLTTAAAGNYFVVVTNVAGAVTSAVAVLTVERLVPAVTWTNPAAITYGTALGGTQLNASTPVAGTFAYSPASGTILPAGTHGLTNEFTPTDATAYVGTTGTVSVVVNPAPLTVTAGSQTRAFGTANGPLTVGYSGLVNGETTNVLTSLAVAATAADVNSLPGSYAITVSGAAGANYNVTHVAGLLTVTAVPPALVLEATNQTVVAGTDVSLVAVATGAPAPGYQWYFDTTNLLAGATNGTLMVTNAQPVNAGGYTVVAANAGGSVTSTVATLTVLVPPSLLTQPQSQLVLAGSNVVFSVGAAGTLPLHHQWLFNGGPLVNETNAVLVVSNAQPAVAGAYSVTVSNAAGGAVSSNAVLSIGALPAIVIQPVGQTSIIGAPLTFFVTATGTPAPTYQWHKNAVPIPGATSSSLSFGSLQGTNAGTYSVVVANAFGMVTSSNAVLQLTTPVIPVIVSPPQSQSALEGGTVTFSVGASGTPTPTYQWVKDSNALPGATNASLTLTNLTLADAGSFVVQVFNAFGSVSSTPVTLQVFVPPAITVQPTNVTTVLGANASFAVTATGVPAPVHQWFKDGQPIASPTAGYLGQTTSNLTALAVQPAQTGTYYVVVTNVAGSVTSAPVTLNLTPAPLITVHPVDVLVVRTNFGPVAPVAFSVTATGAPPLSYQWRFNGTGLPDATNATLTWTNFARSNAGLFSVLVSNPGGSVLSSNALLQIRVAQIVGVPVRLASGAVRVSFGDMDGFGVVASNVSRFEVQFTTNFVDWVASPFGLSMLNGKFILDDPGQAASPRRFYRVIER